MHNSPDYVGVTSWAVWPAVQECCREANWSDSFPNVKLVYLLAPGTCANTSSRRFHPRLPRRPREAESKGVPAIATPWVKTSRISCCRKPANWCTISTPLEHRRAAQTGWLGWWTALQIIHREPLWWWCRLFNITVWFHIKFL